MATRNTKVKDIRLLKREVRAITRAISDPRRFDILRHIAEAESCAACSDLRASFPISAATLSHHLKELEASGLITIARRGKFVDTTFNRAKWTAYLAELHQL
ncbi:MAG: transcriptional regulator, ArsR family [Acidobacteriales bacterium]|nr:transcriptional regulator, ArsR family [Terriglobales bacterium]